MPIKKTISLSEKIYELAQAKADDYFNGNLSAYIAYLIAKDNEVK